MTINKQAIEEGYTKGIEKAEPNKALKRATDTLGTEQGTELFNQAQVETIANSIIANKDYLYKSGTEKHDKEMSNLVSKALTYSKKYLDKNISIQNNNNLSKEGKTKQLTNKLN